MSGDRTNFESQWIDIADRALPGHRRLFSGRGQGAKGERNTELIFDSTASIAINRFASILDSLLTPRNQIWHRVVPTDPALMKNRQVISYMEELTRIIFKYRYAPRANFSSQNQLVWKSLGGYGTGTMFVDDYIDERGVANGMRYRNIHLGENYIDENHQGLIDTDVRRFALTARQAAQKWGDKIADKIKAALQSNPDQEFEFIHHVYPNENYNPNVVGPAGMRFASCYVSLEGQKIMSEAGYYTFPYPTSRYEQVAGEVYGRSPAMEVLPAIKMLNSQKKTVLKAGHRIADPILAVHDDGVIDTPSLRPGSTITGGVSAEGRLLVQPIPVGNVNIGKDLMDDERAVINDAFLVTLFQILTETPDMTATEVMERTREKGILLAPTLGRQTSEYLGPMIDREIDILSRQGKLPPMPQILREARGEYQLEYDSPLSRTQRAEEAAGLMRSVETVLSIVNITQNPAPLDHFNWDEVVPDLNLINGVPAKWTRSIEEVTAIREGRQAQMDRQDQIQASTGAAAMANAVTKAKEADTK